MCAFYFVDKSAEHSELLLQNILISKFPIFTCDILKQDLLETRQRLADSRTKMQQLFCKQNWNPCFGAKSL